MMPLSSLCTALFELVNNTGGRLIIHWQAAAPSCHRTGGTCATRLSSKKNAVDTEFDAKACQNLSDNEGAKRKEDGLTRGRRGTIIIAN